MVINIECILTVIYRYIVKENCEISINPKNFIVKWKRILSTEYREGGFVREPCNNRKMVAPKRQRNTGSEYVFID